VGVRGGGLGISFSRPTAMFAGKRSWTFARRKRGGGGNGSREGGGWQFIGLSRRSAFNCRGAAARSIAVIRDAVQSNVGFRRRPTGLDDPEKAIASPRRDGQVGWFGAQRSPAMTGGLKSLGRSRRPQDQRHGE
jgi:hypothetical protein